MRSFSFLMTVVVGFGFDFVIADDELDESKALATIELLGGRVWKSDTLPGSPVVGVSFVPECSFNEKNANVLKQFKHLTAVWFNFPSRRREGTITDVFLEELKDCKNLTWISLGKTNVTDAGLKKLNGLENLTTLSLYGTQITDAGVKAIVNCKGLTSLDLGLTQITDAGLRTLSQLTNLTALRITSTKITDEGLKELINFEKLTTLDLSFTSITDEGLKELTDLQNLEFLTLDTTQIIGPELRKLRKNNSFQLVMVLDGRPNPN
jgi:internalin A